jgi:hypothetical protein
LPQVSSPECPPSLRKRFQKNSSHFKVVAGHSDSHFQVCGVTGARVSEQFCFNFHLLLRLQSPEREKRAQNLQGQGVVVSYSQSVLKRLANKKNLFPLLFTTTGNYRTGNSLVSCESKNRQNSDSYRIPLHTQECIHSSDATTYVVVAETIHLIFKQQRRECSRNSRTKFGKRREKNVKRLKSRGNREDSRKLAGTDHPDVPSPPRNWNPNRIL